MTFGLMAWMGQPLRPSVVFTSLALFNMLIAPLKWVRPVLVIDLHDPLQRYACLCLCL